MTSYRDLKKNSEKDLNAFTARYMFFAFSEKQFADGMAKLGLKPNETGKIRGLGSGAYIRADKIDDYQKLTRDQDDKVRRASRSESFAFEMFCTELANHEYPVSMDPTDAVLATGYTMEEVNSNPTLRRALNDAKAYIMSNSGSISQNSKPKGSRCDGKHPPSNVQNDPGWIRVEGQNAYTALGMWKVEKSGRVWNLWGPNGFTGSYPTLSEAGRAVTFFTTVGRTEPSKNSKRRSHGRC